MIINPIYRLYISFFLILFFKKIIIQCQTADYSSQEQYFLDRFKLDQIDPIFLSSISTQSPYVTTGIEQSTKITNINNLAFHKGFIYLGAQNWLLKINSKTFKIEQSIRYGPVLDSPMCRYNPIDECLQLNQKYVMNNYNKLLIVYEQRNLLLTCWTARQGVCDLRDLDDLNKLVQNSSIGTVANDPFNTTIGFIASSANSQDLFYVASTHNNLGPYRDEIPALAGRSLQFNSNNKFMQIITSNSQGLKASKASIEFMARFMKTFIVKYINAFNLGIYNYFLTVQHMDTDSLQKGDLLLTKISRLCLNDLSFTKSYTEIPLKCTSGFKGSITSLRPIDYNELIASKVVEIDSESYLIGLFQQTSRSTFNSSLDQDYLDDEYYSSRQISIKQAVCVYPIKLIQAKIKENIRKCYNNEQANVMRGLNFIKPDQKCSSSRSIKKTLSSDYSQINDDFCSSADNGLYPIGGQIPAISNAILEFDTASSLKQAQIYFDSIQVYTDSVATSLILMSNKREEIRFYNLVKLVNSDPILFRSIRLSSNEDTRFNADLIKTPLTNLQFELNSDLSTPNLILSSKNSLVKLKMSSCESYKTCNECLIKSSSTDPYCGWCSLSNECTTKAKCMSTDTSTLLSSDISTKWLNGAKLQAPNDTLMLESMCVDIDRIEPLWTYKTESEWIEINFRKELVVLQNSSYQCVFTNALGSFKTDALQITSNKLKCSLPHMSKLQPIFQSNLFKQQELSLSEDGIFKTSPNGIYYFEQRSDRVNLGIYVQNSNLKYGTLDQQSKTLFNITVIDCDSHKSCVSCTQAQNAKCKWCQNKCVNPNEADKCINDPSACSSFDPGTNKLLIPFTAHRPQAPLLFTISNTDISQQSKIECLFTMFNGKFIEKNVTLPFQYINKTHAHCQLANVFNNLDGFIQETGEVQTNLRLYDSQNDYFIDSISNGKLALLFYKCEIKANDCSSCLSINRQLSCMWCASMPTQSSCRFMNAQSKLAALSQCISPASSFFSAIGNQSSQCEKPQITNVQPIKLPVGGGTTLVINGVNLGSVYDDLLSVNIVCGEMSTKCDLIEQKYIPSKQIACKTRASSIGAQKECRVSVKLKTNVIISGSSTSELGSSGIMSITVSGSQEVDYVDPIINEIEPATIIQSANFVWLTIKGDDLDAGRTRQIQILDYTNAQQTDSNYRIVKCEIKNATNKEIHCRLNDKFRTLGKKNLKIIFDETMSIMHYLSLRVTSDPLVKSIDKQVTFYPGGTQFKLNGFNFDSVQSVYTYVVYKDLWYSEPLQARQRISNEYILFDFPQLTEGFFDLVKQQQLIFTVPTNKQKPENEKYELQIGFLMDGFNVTLKDFPIVYLPTLNQDLVSIQNLDISIKSASLFSLIVDLKIDNSILNILYDSTNNLLKENLQVYVACSLCSSLEWLNETRFTCQLPSLQQSLNSSSPMQFCESKAFNTILNKLNKNKLSLLNFFIGNMELEKEKDFTDSNENLKIYIQTFTLNNIDNFNQIAQALAAQTTNSNLIQSILRQQANFLNSQSDSIVLSSNTTTKNLLLISSIIATLLVMLILITVILSTFILKMKRKCSKFDSNSNADNLSKKLLLRGKHTLIGKKSDKQLKQEFELIQQQIDLLELNIRPQCAQLYQQLHNDYLNELNNDLIYTICGLPIWNYKTYLFNILFPQSNNINNFLAIEVSCPSSGSTSTNSSVSKQQVNLMSSSSMSNSTTNTLLSSTLTPIQQKQQQQQQNSSMSVYATIKSSSMLRFDTLDQSDAQAKQQFMSYGNVGEAMQLFDQLIHNKNFLLTFLNVCEQQTSTFTLKDKINMASLLILSLKDNLPYLYSIIKCLLSEYISVSFKQKLNSKQKILFRTNESLIEPLLTNWISMFMYDFQRDTQCAMHLYRLVKSIKFYLDMGPCDQVKQLALNSLNEDKLLTDLGVHYQIIYANIVINQCLLSNPSNKSLYVCPLCDCDTILQAKEKILDYIFKPTNLAQFNLSSKPTLRDIDLELCLILIPSDQSTQQTTLITLKETKDELIGSDTGTENQFKRLLTLKDYNIQNGSFINLSFKNSQLIQPTKEQQQHVYMSTMSMNNEYLLYASNTLIRQNTNPRTKQTPLPLPLVPPPPLPNRYHLIAPTDPSSNPTETMSTTVGTKQKKKKKNYEKLLTVKSQDSAVTTASLITNENINTNTSKRTTPSSLNRLLMNKGTIQPFIDQFIEAIFANTSNLPPIVQHLFEFFDTEVKKHQNECKNTDELSKLSRAWKNNVFFLRYWVNMIKNPEFLLDTNKSNLMDSSLTCIAQAFIDSCSTVDSHNLYDTNSPINRLLFIREVPRYKEMIDKFYNEIKSYQTTSDHELHFYLNEFSKCKLQDQNATQILGATINNQMGQCNHHDVNQVQVLLQMYEYYEKYEQQINTALGQQQCSILLPVHHRLVQIKDLMMSNNAATTNSSVCNPTTLNRTGTPYFNNQYQQIGSAGNQYQQPINCYAATSDIMTSYPPTLPHLPRHQFQQQFF